MKIIGFLTLMFLFVLVPFAAAAEPICGDHAKLVAHLGDSYKEFPKGMGLVTNGPMMELLVGENGSWTMLVTLPGGETCVFLVGEGWAILKILKPAPGKVS